MSDEQNSNAEQAAPQGGAEAKTFDAEYVARMDGGGFDWAAYDVPDDLGVPVLSADTTDGLAPRLDELCAAILGR